MDGRLSNKELLRQIIQKVNTEVPRCQQSNCQTREITPIELIKIKEDTTPEESKLKNNILERLNEIKQSQEINSIITGARLGLSSYQKPTNGIPLEDLNISLQTLIQQFNVHIQQKDKIDLDNFSAYIKFNNIKHNSIYDTTNKQWYVELNETDPTVPIHVKQISTTNINNWNNTKEKVDQLANVAFSADYADLINIPQNISDFNDDIQIDSRVETLEGKVTVIENNPANTITSQDVENWNSKQNTIKDLQTIREGAALGATALQNFTETDPTVPSWAKAESKPTYTASEVGALPSTTSIPANTSDLNNDSNFVSDASYVHTDNNYTSEEKTKLSNIEAGAEVNVNADWNAISGDALILNKPTLSTVATTGDYNDLLNKPTIPTVPSGLNGFTITETSTKIVLAVWDGASISENSTKIILSQ